MESIWTNSLICTFYAILAISTISAAKMPPPCDSPIYCHGPLLHTVQMAHLYKDSKHFVDMSLTQTPEHIIASYERFMIETRGQPSKEQVQQFVNANFKEPSSEFISWNPDDWIENPKFLQNVADRQLRSWGNELNDLWKVLGRKISQDVKNSPEMYSQIYVDNPVIVPGGRFREFYYWDSYWTMEGLLLCNMTNTVKGMLQNFVQMVRTYGMVPNGGRVYYTRRSQPPYLISMFKMYYDYTKDDKFILENLDALEQEFTFWENNRTHHVRDGTGKVHKVTQYSVYVDGPRPEAYSEDYNLARNLSTQWEKQQLYVELKSGAESGWDYSTRWFVVGDSNNGTLADLNVTAIAPVDLNSLMCRNARILSDFYKLTGNEEKVSEFDELANIKNQTMAELFWDEKDGIWYDINIHTELKRRFFYLSNVHPLWSGCYGLEGNKASTIKKVIQYLKREKVVDFIGGVPTTKRKSGEQWDFPNAWAPLEHLVIMGLYHHAGLVPEAGDLSFNLADKWVKNNWAGFRSAGVMFEKYDVNTQGIPGGGGEYEVVVGFGWSNGVALKLLETFGNRLTTDTTDGSSYTTITISLLIFPILAFLINH